MIVLVADITDFNDIDLFDKGLSLVSQTRRDKVNKYTFDEDKKRSLAAGLLLNLAVQQWERGINDYAEPEVISGRTLVEKFDKSYDYEIETAEGGKPSFRHASNIHFSLSHAGSVAACAVSKTNVGVDVEGNRNYTLKIARRFFSTGETVYVESSENKRVEADRFFEIWTKKEAYCKMTGIGIPKGMSTCVFIDEEGREILHPEIEVEGFKVKGYTVTAFCEQ